jgi:hypothetical protein
MTVNVFHAGANRRADVYVFQSGANRLVKQMYVFHSGANRLVNGALLQMTVGNSGGLYGYNTGGAPFGALSPNTVMGGTVTRLCFGSISGAGLGLHFITSANTSALQGLVLNGTTYTGAGGFYNATERRWYWPIPGATPPYGLTLGGTYSVLIY